MQKSYDSVVARLASELVRIPSLSGQEQAVGQRVAQAMEMMGFAHVQADGLGNVVGLIPGQGDNVVLFDAHMDTVPVTSPDAWRHEPFGGQIAEGRLWGRGATDVKGSLAAALVGLGSLIGSPEQPRGTLVLAASVGEEMSEGAALRSVLETYRPTAVVVCEPTELKLGLGHKGRAGVILTARGVPAHSSQPQLGLNAVYLMCEAIAAIRRCAPHHDALLGESVREVVEMVSAPFPGTSLVPDGCQVRWDCRLVRGETPQSLLDEFTGLPHAERLAAHYHQPVLRCPTGVELGGDDFHAAWATEPDAPLVRQALAALRAEGLPAESWLAPYCTNGAVSAGELGIATLIYGAGSIADAHGIDESVALQELAQAWRGYRALGRALAAGVPD